MTRAIRAFLALTLLAAPLAAQNPVAARMLSLQGKPANDEASGCKLSGGDFHVSGAATYFSTALSTSVTDNKLRALANGHDQVLQAITNGQAGSSKAWYYLGRISLQQGDLVGADSAFTRAVRLAPGCATDVNLYRSGAWRLLVAAASSARTANQPDSMVILANAANQIDPTHPQGWYLIGAYHLDQDHSDSGLYYMTKALEASDTTPSARGVRQAAAFQVGVLSYNAHDFVKAARGFGIAVQLKPDDGDAKRNLAAALRQAGMADSAKKIEQSMMNATAGSDQGLSVAQLFDIGVAQFNEGKFADAATTFQKIVDAEPYNRDALFNLAQSYKGASNADSLLSSAMRLHAMDPLSFEALQLVGAGYSAKHDQPKLLETATALGGATVDVKVTNFQPTATGATLTMHAVGRDGRDINDRPVRAAAVPIVVEFLDQSGTVVGSAETTVPALAKDAAQDLTVTGTGAGITAWRYHKK